MVDLVERHRTSRSWEHEMSAELYRRNADDCRQRSMQANRSEDKAAWLKLAEEWQKLAEDVDAAEATRQDR
jgi:hypothetical protein